VEAEPAAEVEGGSQREAVEDGRTSGLEGEEDFCMAEARSRD
jgi:hypothetical protein